MPHNQRPPLSIPDNFPIFILLPSTPLSAVSLVKADSPFNQRPLPCPLIQANTQGSNLAAGVTIEAAARIAAHESPRTTSLYDLISPLMRTTIFYGIFPFATHHVRITVDKKRELIYVFLNRYLTLPNNHPNRDAVLRALMKKNWDLNLGRFEWDPSDGELRFAYTFSTENGVGYEAFEAVVLTLLQTGDKLWPEFNGMVGNSGK